MNSSLEVRLHVGQGTTRGALTLFPVWTDGAPSSGGYLTGRAAAVEVAERAGSPVVEELIVTNRGNRPALLLAGELLEGGWQTRAFAATTLLAPGRPTVQPVVCVEQGRWHGGAVHQYQCRARRAPVGVMRAIESQHEVWDRVHGYAAVVGFSPTESLADRLDVTAPVARASPGGCGRSPASAACSLASPGGPSPWSCSTRAGRWRRTGRRCCTRRPWTRSAGPRSAPPRRWPARSPSGSRAPRSPRPDPPGSVHACAAAAV